ncbi:MAG: phosphoribosylanthranilate isomerase [Candidatus Omnitrophica bacterium]|nr:phosphoribosylanthranilate isomerase [Candidatus Omnitrophota bacterium]
MVKVKICGITNLEDALNAIDAGCDALGFVFYKKSPRYIVPLAAKRLINNLPQRTIKIGIFVNEKETQVRKVAKLCKLDMLQFHGDETVEFCARFKGYKIIKAFRVKDKINIPDILRYKVFAYLFDTFVESERGGTGKKFNWRLLSRFGGIKQPIFLSGGLNKDNVKKAISSVRPDWVDVSTGVEIKPGKKDYRKIRDFIGALKK